MAAGDRNMSTLVSDRWAQEIFWPLCTHSFQSGGLGKRATNLEGSEKVLFFKHGMTFREGPRVGLSAALASQG